MAAEIQRSYQCGASLLRAEGKPPSGQHQGEGLVQGQDTCLSGSMCAGAETNWRDDNGEAYQASCTMSSDSLENPKRKLVSTKTQGYYPPNGLTMLLLRCKTPRVEEGNNANMM